jgi:hypothetical protein
LCGHCKFTPTELSLSGLDLQTSKSQLKGDIQLNYEDIASLTHFTDKVQVIAQLEALKVDAGELGQFVPYFAQYQDTYRLSGKLVGKVDDFAIEDFRFQFGQQQSHLNGQVSLRGLPNPQKTFFSLRLGESCVYVQDLLSHVPKQYHKNLQQLSVCTLQGSVLGTAKNFVSQANFDFEIGKVGTQLEVTMDSDFQTISYQGTITTDQLAIGRLLGISQLQELTMQAQIAGQGLSLSTAALHIKADVHDLGFNHYEYKHIRTDGRFEKAFFKGLLAVSDPNLNLQVNTTIDWREAVKKVDIQGKLTKAVLDKLHITNQQVQLSTDIAVTVQGSSLDDLNTDVLFSHINFGLARKPLYLKEFHMVNLHQEGYNKFAITSDLFTVQADGGSTYTALVHDIQQLIQAYQQRLFLKEPFKPQYTKQPYKFSYSVNLKDANPLLGVFIPDLYIAPNTNLTGSFEQQDSVALTLELPRVDSLAFKDFDCKNTSLVVKASHYKDGSMLLASGKLMSENQQWGSQHMTNQLLVDVVWNNDQIVFAHSLHHPSKLHQLNLQGKAILHEDLVKVVFNQADIQIANRRWNLHPDNLIQIDKSQIQGHNLIFTHEEQQISLEGSYSAQLTEDLQLKFHQFSLDNFNPLLPQKINGIANGSILLQGTKKNLLANSNIHIQDIVVGDFLIGDLQSQTDWDSEKQRLNVACHITHLQRPTVDITGFYKPTDLIQPLNLAANFSKAQLATLEPFLGTLFSQLSGELEGRFKIQGTLAKPQIIGQAQITQGIIKSSYLNALYHGEGVIYFDEKAIHTQALNLTDDQQGEAVLRGAIYHNRFQDMKLDLKVAMRDFKGIATNQENNSDFYGTGILSGNMTLSGPVDKLVIAIKATTKQGTNLTIPIQKYGKQVDQEDYIKFINLQAPKSEEEEQVRVVKLKGISLNLDLEITPDAWIAIILNADNGDTIQSRGKGNLQLKVDPEGTLIMTGHYELVEGKYTFSIYNMIKKQFKILEGSNITWYDKPDEGILHVQAAYDQRVSLFPLLANTPIDESNREATTQDNTHKYPVRALLILQGVLSQPDISFKVEFMEVPEQPDFQAAINNFLAKAAADEPYLLSQVFSLVILKRFYSENLVATSSGTLGRSVGEIFSQQLSSFASQLDENLEIDVDLADLEKGARLKLGYHLLSGRLKISREGSINLKNETKTDVADLVGDLALEYMLTKDKRWRVKLYSKHIRRDQDKEGGSMFVGGLSLRYIKSFNWWKEIFSIHQTRRKQDLPDASSPEKQTGY